MIRCQKATLAAALSLALAALATASPLAAAGDAVRAASNGGSSLAGTFLVTATFTDPADIPPSQVLITFMPGRNANEGTLVDTNTFQNTPPIPCSPDQGVWRRKGGSFIATHYNFCFDADNGNVPAGPTKIRDRLFLGNGGETLTGTQYVEGYDTDGNLVFVGRVTLQGTRVHAEAPPAD